MSTKTNATIEDLYRHDGGAELVNGEIVPMNPTGDFPGAAAGEIYFHLRLFLQNNHLPGRAYPDNVGFVVDLPHRKSFSPDVAYFVGERTGMKFIEGAPQFAVEVRSENDYGAAAEKKHAEKRADYFAAGTQLVWDVDLLNENVITSYRSPNDFATYRRGDYALAEPVLPGWKFLTEELFR